MIITKQLLCSQYGMEQGHLIRTNSKKLKCKKCGCKGFWFVERPNCVSCGQLEGKKFSAGKGILYLI